MGSGGSRGRGHRRPRLVEVERRTGSSTVSFTVDGSATVPASRRVAATTRWCGRTPPSVVGRCSAPRYGGNLSPCRSAQGEGNGHENADDAYEQHGQGHPSGPSARIVRIRRRRFVIGQVGHRSSVAGRRAIPIRGRSALRRASRGDRSGRVPSRRSPPTVVPPRGRLPRRGCWRHRRQSSLPPNAQRSRNR